MKKLDATEAATGAVVGLAVGVSLNHFALPFWGFEPSLTDSLGIGALFFAASFGTRYVVRRLFRGLA